MRKRERESEKENWTILKFIKIACHTEMLCELFQLLVFVLLPLRCLSPSLPPILFSCDIHQAAGSKTYFLLPFHFVVSFRRFLWSCAIRVHSCLGSHTVAAAVTLPQHCLPSILFFFENEFLIVIYLVVATIWHAAIMCARIPLSSPSVSSLLPVPRIPVCWLFVYARARTPYSTMRQHQQHNTTSN